MYITKCEIDDQSKFDAWNRALKAGALGSTQRDVAGREVGGGFGMGDAGTPMADACQCMSKTTKMLSSNYLRLKWINKFKKQNKNAQAIFWISDSSSVWSVDQTVEFAPVSKV